MASLHDRAQRVFDLRDGLLEMLENRVGKEFAGLGAAARAACAEGVLSPCEKRRAEHIDIAYNIVRHMTSQRKQKYWSYFTDCIVHEQAQAEPSSDLELPGGSFSRADSDVVGPSAAHASVQTELAMRHLAHVAGTPLDENVHFVASDEEIEYEQGYFGDVSCVSLDVLARGVVLPDVPVFPTLDTTDAEQGNEGYEDKVPDVIEVGTFIDNAKAKIQNKPDNYNVGTSIGNAIAKIQDKPDEDAKTHDTPDEDVKTKILHDMMLTLLKN